VNKGDILLIDDNLHLRQTLSDHLAHEGYDVRCAQSGEEGLELLAAREPDLIILDINMPGMGGVGFVRRILGKDGHPKHPVLVLTARSNVSEFFETVSVEGFLTKPCPMSEMLKRIEIAVTRSRGKRGRGKRTSVLIAENDLRAADALVAAFENAGMFASVADSGPEALEKAPLLRPSLVLVKQMLPRLNGTILAPLLAALPEFGATPIILYDESRRHVDSGAFVEALPASVTRFVASNRPEDLLRLATQVLARA
jgi:DNA-binding response OmpR family regulator